MGLAEREALVGQLPRLVPPALVDSLQGEMDEGADRRRHVATADETRRRIQRDLHDGAQQRLVHTVLLLQVLKEALRNARMVEAGLVDDALQNARQATAELRELVHGIMPAALSRGGLRAGVESLAGQMALSVHVDVLAERLPPGLETTAYFVVAEALTNAVKHAHAGAVHVSAAIDRTLLRVVVRDDGIGGADRTRGTGLVGLADRVAAGGGTLAISSPPGGGTTVAAELPIPLAGGGHVFPAQMSRSDPMITVRSSGSA